MNTLEANTVYLKLITEQKGVSEFIQSKDEWIGSRWTLLVTWNLISMYTWKYGAAMKNF